jgi:cytochrome b pre-mRNA-processing protein 3
MFRRFLRRDPRSGGIAPLIYGAIVAQARRPALYAGLEVPDTVDGRFEMIILHGGLVIRRLGKEDEESREAGQAVFDLFCGDMDRSLRELGVGDLAVPKRMRWMAEAFYGRSAAYDAAIAAEDLSQLAAAIARTVYRNQPPAMAAEGLAAYMLAAAGELAATPKPALLAGRIPWPDPAAFVVTG